MVSGKEYSAAAAKFLAQTDFISMLEIQEELLGAWKTDLRSNDWKLWANQIFFRSFLSASSLRMLCSGTKMKGIVTDRRHLDTASIYNIARSIFEDYLIYKYIFIDSTSPERRDYLLQTYELGSKVRLLEISIDMKRAKTEIEKSQQKVDEAKKIIAEHPYLASASDEEKQFSINGIQPGKKFKFGKLSNDPQHQLLGVLQFYKFNSLHAHPTFLPLQRQIENDSMDKGLKELDTFIFPQVSMILALFSQHYSGIDPILTAAFDKSRNKAKCLVLCSAAGGLPSEYEKNS